MSGWLIQVPVQRFGGSGRPVAHLYAAWIADPYDAMDAVKNHTGEPHEKPETLVELSDAALIGLGLQRGAVCRLQAYS